MCATHKQEFIGMIAPNPHLFRYFLWKYNFYLDLFIYANYFRNLARP